MKKLDIGIKMIILFLFIFLITTSNVEAKEVFKLYWKTDEYTYSDYTYSSDYNIRNTEFNNGYVTTRYETDSNGNYYTYINYYDYQGNLKNKSNELGYGLVLDMVSYDEYLYALSYNYSNIYLLKINDNFKVVNYINFDYSTSNALLSMLHSEIPLFGINLLSVNNNGIKVLTIDYNYIDVKTDFSSYSNEEYDESVMKEYFPELHELDNYYISDVYYYNLKKNDKNIVLSGIKPNECLYTSNTCDYDSTAYMTLQDSNGKELWSKEYSNYKEFINTIFVGKYIVTIGIKDLNDLAPCDIVVINLDGNIVQTIENKNSYYFMQGTSKGIIVTNYRENTSSGNNGLDENATVTSNTEVYQLIYDIEQKISGKGKVEVISSSLAGNSITFRVTPNYGYILDYVNVTDSEGNTVQFKNDTFTMPSSDVIIEAKFIQIVNPNTGLATKLFALTVLITTISFIGVIVLAIKRKKEIIKNVKV